MGHGGGEGGGRGGGVGGGGFRELIVRHVIVRHDESLEVAIILLLGLTILEITHDAAVYIFLLNVEKEASGSLFAGFFARLLPGPVLFLRSLCKGCPTFDSTTRGGVETIDRENPQTKRKGLIALEESGDQLQQRSEGIVAQLDGLAVRLTFSFKQNFQTNAIVRLCTLLLINLVEESGKLNIDVPEQGGDIIVVLWVLHGPLKHQHGSMHVIGLCVWPHGKCGGRVGDDVEMKLHGGDT